MSMRKMKWTLGVERGNGAVRQKAKIMENRMYLFGVFFVLSFFKTVTFYKIETMDAQVGFFFPKEKLLQT